jgi:hypothetical protein
MAIIDDPMTFGYGIDAIDPAQDGLCRRSA